VSLASLGWAASGPKNTRAHDQAMTRALDRLLAAPVSAGGFWGVYVYSLDRHRVLYDHNGERWFTPASNAKLFTLAAALHQLGPDFRFHTAVTSTAAPDAAGVVAGDVVLAGVGDPSLNGRGYPYSVPPQPPLLPYDVWRVPRALAQQIKSKGITHITGAIIGDASYFAPAPYPDGWSIGDRIWDYGAPVSALTVNDNTRFLEIAAGAEAGTPVRLRWAPEIDLPAMVNTATTAAAGTGSQLRLAADPLHPGGLVLSGTLGMDSRGDLEALAVQNPAQFAAAMLRQALIEAGIAVDGDARAQLAPTPTAAAAGYELGGWDSPPLAQILQATAKESQNLEAELMLRVLGKLGGDAGVRASRGESAAGEGVVQGFLHDAGLGATDAELVDGSGLARTDLVTPAGIARLLEYMSRQPEAAVWRDLLPVAASDGTLLHRFRHTPAAGVVEAKTGSLSHVNSLSGYATTPGGEHLVFTLLSNNEALPAAAVRAQLDRLAVAIVAP